MEVKLAHSNEQNISAIHTAFVKVQFVVVIIFFDVVFANELHFFIIVCSIYISGGKKQ